MKKELLLKLTDDIKVIEEEIITPNIKEFISNNLEEIQYIEKLTIIDSQTAHLLIDKIRNKYKQEVTGVLPEQEVKFQLTGDLNYSQGKYYKEFRLYSKIKLIKLYDPKSLQAPELKKLFSEESYEKLINEFEEMDNKLELIREQENNLLELKEMAKTVKDTSLADKLLWKLDNIRMLLGGINGK